MLKRVVANILDALTLQTYSYYQLYMKSQWWARDRLRDFQLKQLKILGRVWGLKIESWEDFHSLPLSSKEDIEGFRPKKGESFHIHRTSGSTGYPLEIYLPKDNLEMKEGMFLRHWNWIGRKDELLVRWLSGKPEFAWLDYFRNIKPLDFRKIGDKEIDWIVKNKPPFMHVTVFTIKEVLSLLKQRNETQVLKNTTLWLTGENTESHKKDIAKYFKDIYDGYGLAELTPIATECPYHRMHVTMEVAVAEVIDGEIIVTSPYNFITPIIRYRTGDQGKIRKSDCPCGRKLDILYNLDGKSHDYYDGPETKTPIGWLTVSPISKKFLGIVKTWRAEVKLKERKFIFEIIWKNKEEFEKMEWYRKWVEKQTGLKCEIKTRTKLFEGKKLLVINE